MKKHHLIRKDAVSRQKNPWWVKMILYVCILGVCVNRFECIYREGTISGFILLDAIWALALLMLAILTQRNIIILSKPFRLAFGILAGIDSIKIILFAIHWLHLLSG